MQGKFHLAADFYEKDTMQNFVKLSEDLHVYLF